MSKNYDKNFQAPATGLSPSPAPFIPAPKAFNSAGNVNTEEDESTPLLHKNKVPAAPSDHKILNIPQTNFASLLKPQDSGTKSKGFFSRLTAPVTKLINKASESAPGKILPWLTSKGVMKIVNLVVPIMAFSGLTALSGGIVPFVALGIAGAVTIVNTIREVYVLRGKKHLAEEHKLIQEYKAAQNASEAGLNFLKKQKGIDLADNKNTSDASVNMQSKFKSKYENNLTARPLRKIIQNSLFEASGNIMLVGVVATSGLANAAMNAMSVGATAGIFTAVDIALTLRENKRVNIIKNALRKEIDEMREGVPAYKSLEELREITHAQQIKTEAVRQVLRHDTRYLEGSELKEKIREQEKIAAAKPEFALPPSKSLWGKTKELVKDLHMVNWPDNDYYTAEKYAASRDKVKQNIINHYDGVAKEIHASCKEEVPGEYGYERKKSFVEQLHAHSVGRVR